MQKPKFINVTNHVKDENNNTALHLAVLSQDKTIVRKLCKDTNIDPNIINNDEKTALKLAESGDNQRITKIIQKFNHQRENLGETGISVIYKTSFVPRGRGANLFPHSFTLP